ncbi:uncharacterized protein K441DRAFT_126639 [Cenococcum geophilum 1.58]|uniref:uncharacterized protein n=1 Tax=Cenococcum geophilum 1.58 TaxID=794803 RepID=UPI0035900267|nr:hypothetical protein K441DRAFT_126639 [Cenococcum geophilum 1.58]
MPSPLLHFNKQTRRDKMQWWGRTFRILDLRSLKAKARFCKSATFLGYANRFRDVPWGVLNNGSQILPNDLAQHYSPQVLKYDPSTPATGLERRALCRINASCRWEYDAGEI